MARHWTCIVVAVLYGALHVAVTILKLEVVDIGPPGGEPPHDSQKTR